MFAVSATVGFLLEHEPLPDERTVTVDRRIEPPVGDTYRGGEVTTAGGGRIELRTRDGVLELDVPAAVTTEELRRAEAPRFAPGDAVNLGGEQGDFGLVLTGVVALDPAGEEAAP